MTTPTIASSTCWTRSKDKYGRSVHTLERACRSQGVVVRLPKPAAERMGARYLVNLQRGAGPVYIDSLADAKRYVEQAAPR